MQVTKFAMCLLTHDKYFVFDLVVYTEEPDELCRVVLSLSSPVE